MPATARTCYTGLLLLPPVPATVRTSYTGLPRFEGHLACYPPGSAGYSRHVDRHHTDFSQTSHSHRVVSAVLYLNPAGWEPEDGGQLRIYLPAPDKAGGGVAVC